MELDDLVSAYWEASNVSEDRIGSLSNACQFNISVKYNETNKEVDLHKMRDSIREAIGHQANVSEMLVNLALTIMLMDDVTDDEDPDPKWLGKDVDLPSCIVGLICGRMIGRFENKFNVSIKTTDYGTLIKRKPK